MSVDLPLLAFATAQAKHGELDAIGDAVACWRLRNESDRAYGHRLALHIEESLIDREQLLAMVLSLARPDTCRLVSEPFGRPTCPPNFSADPTKKDNT